MFLTKILGGGRGIGKHISCQTCSFGLARVAIVCVCTLVLCKFTSDEPESANGSAAYFKKGKFQFGRGVK